MRRTYHRLKFITGSRLPLCHATPHYVIPAANDDSRRSLCASWKQTALKDIEYAEPYAGGAAIALALLFEEYASVIHINDLGRPIYDFWYMVLNHAEELCGMIESVKVTMD